MWGTAGACDAASMAKMNEWMRSKKNMPAKMTVFDYAYDVLECKWRGWMETVEVMKHPKPLNSKPSIINSIGAMGADGNRKP